MIWVGKQANSSEAFFLKTVVNLDYDRFPRAFLKMCLLYVLSIIRTYFAYFITSAFYFK